MRLFIFCSSLFWASIILPVQFVLADEPKGHTSDGKNGYTTIELTREDRLALSAQAEAFWSKPDLGERLKRLAELEKQALQLAVDEPLKLGSIGTAILDLYPGSQTGHYALARFYAHVESDDAQHKHEQSLAKLQAQMRFTGKGTRAQPFVIMTVNDAHTFAKTSNTSPVGSRYITGRADEFGLLLVTRPEQAPLQRWFFDLSHMLNAFDVPGTGHQQEHEESSTAPSSAADARARPWLLMQALAADMDSAAQTAIGLYLVSVQKFDDALSWLRVGARSGNVIANELMARVYMRLSERAEDEETKADLAENALENHLHAIALGSTDAMYMLANLYLNDFYGAENRAAAIPLLRQAGELNHPDALLYLGHLYNTGREVHQDKTVAESYFAKAAKLNNSQAIISYGRFLTSLSAEELKDDSNHNQVHEWLARLVEKESPEAAVVLGNLHARGIGSRASNRQALRWYKKAIKQAPLNADIVNEVAWTLAVSDIQGLRRAKYAKKVMDHLMENSEDANSRPEFLDTWAAIHAARGDFDQAIILQQKAIETATAQQREDVLDILQEHLQLFETGATITEKAP